MKIILTASLAGELEPGINTDLSGETAIQMSQAISLKRIADALEAKSEPATALVAAPRRKPASAHPRDRAHG